jgi:glucose-6-phosphate-specific signal transduction histidine kinase
MLASVLTHIDSDAGRNMFEFDGAVQSKPMSEELRVFLFKATKELLMNIVKHAQAKKAKVSIRRDKITSGFWLRMTELGLTVIKTAHSA